MLNLWIVADEGVKKTFPKALLCSRFGRAAASPAMTVATRSNRTDYAL